MKKKKTFEDRVNEKINYSADDDGHWIWDGAVTNGIPKIASSSNLHHNVPRYMWRKIFNKEPLRIRNVCGNKLCVNPHHYEEAKKSRFRKIPDEQVLEILELWRLSELHKTTMEKLAARFGVTKQMIELIVNGKARRHADSIVAAKTDMIYEKSIDSE